MDLRVKKTKMLIKNTFLELRKDLPLEKVKVRELCRIAEINKSTFYHHYLDIYDLSDQIENELIDEVLRDFDGKDLLFENPLQFFTSIPMILDEDLLILFKNKEQVLFYKMEQQLLDYYSSYLDTNEQKVKLTFFIGGSMRVLHRFMSDNSIEKELLLQYLSELLNETYRL